MWATRVRGGYSHSIEALYSDCCTAQYRNEHEVEGAEGTADDSLVASGGEEGSSPPGTDPDWWSKQEEAPDTDQEREQEYPTYEYESAQLEYPIVLWTVLIFGLGIVFGRCTVRR